jgi:EAL domain-containing protein (putative c-di-GMP-specific phosphodiesterase class I)
MKVASGFSIVMRKPASRIENFGAVCKNLARGHRLTDFKGSRDPALPPSGVAECLDEAAMLQNVFPTRACLHLLDTSAIAMSVRVDEEPVLASERYVDPKRDNARVTRSITPAFTDVVALNDNLGVMVVEDDALQRRVLVKRLEAIGITNVREATDGVDALEKLDADPSINCVISDLDMPRMDGLELVRAISTRPEPVALAIHSAMDSELLTCAELMCTEERMRFLGIIPKPANAESLERMLARARGYLDRDSRSMLPPVPYEEIVQGLDNNEFEPFFQPKVRMLDGAVVGAEALARWRHPIRGIVSPIQFIDAMEAAGDIHRLTAAILDKSFVELVSWQKRSPHVGVAVNLSLSYLAKPRVSDAILALADSYNLKRHLISLEVTESVAMTQVAPCLENLARLRMRGFKLSADDFGVGYSSLQQLVRVPFQEMKLDRSFVSSVHTNPRAAVVLDATVSLARNLGMATVGEGVETAEDWDYLRDLGCDVAQGYFIGRPMASRQFEEWIHKQSPVRKMD